MNLRRCAIVIPVYQPDPDPRERISLQQCARIFQDYPVVMTGPDGLDLQAYRQILTTAQWEPFPAERYSSIDSYSRLLLDTAFYERFSGYKHILIHQTDAFVFRDELEYWCASEFDYVGSPFPKPGATDLNQVTSWTGGNGGLSLRRVSAFLTVLTKFRGMRLRSVAELFTAYRREKRLFSLRGLAGFCARSLGYQNTMGHYIDTYRWNEDAFWTFEAPRTGQFRVADPETSARFAVETCAPFWYERLAGELPAGCHGWWKYDFEFWKPHIEACGYQLQGATSV